MKVFSSIKAGLFSCVPVSFFFLLLIFSGCAAKQTHKESPLVSMQIIDRNGFAETIGSKERLSPYASVNFFEPQPYQKVLRVYAKNEEGKSKAALTTYHSNGQIWQYLDLLDGRAHGSFQEWYPNGTTRLQLTVIDGTADTNDLAQCSWIFEGKSSVYSSDGHLQAEIFYEKGVLQGPSLYYYPSGKLHKIIPYTNDAIDGCVVLYNEEQQQIEKIHYKNGLKEGEAVGFWEDLSPQYKEFYEKDLLSQGVYYTPTGEISSEVHNGNGLLSTWKENCLFSLIEYKKGKAEGLVQQFSPAGWLQNSYSILNETKTGVEQEFYPPQAKEDAPQPKLLLTWNNDLLHGPVKTWYPNGAQESEREMANNKKEGVSLAWYEDGSLMLAEEYQHNHLVKGSYFERGNKTPVSKVEKGKGTATLYDSQGRFQKKIDYEKGQPLLSR